MLPRFSFLREPCAVFRRPWRDMMPSQAISSASCSLLGSCCFLGRCSATLGRSWVHFASPRLLAQFSLYQFPYPNSDLNCFLWFWRLAGHPLGHACRMTMSKGILGLFDVKLLATPQRDPSSDEHGFLPASWTYSRHLRELRASVLELV